MEAKNNEIETVHKYVLNTESWLFIIWLTFNTLLSTVSIWVSMNNSVVMKKQITEINYKLNTVESEEDVLENKINILSNKKDTVIVNIKNNFTLKQQ